MPDNRFNSPLIVTPLCLLGLCLIILAVVCFLIGPAEEPSDAGSAEESSHAEDVAQVGLEVPPDTPVRLPKGVPPGTAVQISASEDLDEGDGSAGDDEPPNP